MNDVTQILDRVHQGDPLAANELLPLVYQELRRIAAHKMAGESSAHTLQATALVHEAWLRLVDKDGQAQFQNRAHFFAAAAEAMRRILIDRARRKLARKHGGRQEHVNVDEVEIPAPAADEEMLAVNDALDRFAAVDGQKAELIKLRYFVGLTIDEAANVLGISVPTANRWWVYGRAWLFSDLKPVC